MTKDLSNLVETKRALQDLRLRIEQTELMLKHLHPNNSFEEEAKDAFTNVLGRYLTIRHALEREKERLEKS